MQGCHHVTKKNLIQLLYHVHFIFGAGEMHFFYSLYSIFKIYSYHSERHRISFLLKKVYYFIVLQVWYFYTSIHYLLHSISVVYFCVCVGRGKVCVQPVLAGREQDAFQTTVLFSPSRCSLKFIFRSLLNSLMYLQYS